MSKLQNVFSYHQKVAYSDNNIHLFVHPVQPCMCFTSATTCLISKKPSGIKPSSTYHIHVSYGPLNFYSSSLMHKRPQVHKHNYIIHFISM
jgi:hypothetical protein